MIVFFRLSLKIEKLEIVSKSFRKPTNCLSSVGKIKCLMKELLYQKTSNFIDTI